MRAKLCLLVCLVAAGELLAGTIAKYHRHGAALLPDPDVTPGAIRTTDAKDVCEGGSTKQYRHTTPKEKREAYAEYNAKKKRGTCCEVDHLIPLELGGADELKNLWAQPYKPAPGAHEKDLAETYLHGKVCRGEMSLKAAQSAIASDWYAVYLEMKKATD